MEVQVEIWDFYVLRADVQTYYQAVVCIFMYFRTAHLRNEKDIKRRLKRQFHRLLHLHIRISTVVICRTYVFNKDVNKKHKLT